MSPQNEKHEDTSKYLLAIPAHVSAVSKLFSLTLSCAQEKSAESLQTKTVEPRINPADGSNTIFDLARMKPVLHSDVAAEVDHHWLSASDYPRDSIEGGSGADDLGTRNSLTISNRDPRGQPDLIYSLHEHHS